ncbi:MAG TPA: tetratricopeptide repeat protein [Candidatus Koribacter sp.]
MHEAVLAMGWFYLNGFGVEKDLRQAERWYKKSARQGEPMAMFSLGVMACETRDYADALIWFRRAAEKRHVRSLFWLGKLHWRGHGVPKDHKQALALLREAANGKVEAAQRAIRFLSRHRQ